MEKLHNVNQPIPNDLYKRKKALHSDTTWMDVIITGIDFLELLDKIKLPRSEIVKKLSSLIE